MPSLRFSSEWKMSRTEANRLLTNSAGWNFPSFLFFLVSCYLSVCRGRPITFLSTAGKTLENPSCHRTTLSPFSAPATACLCYIAPTLPFFFFASVPAVAGENLAHILLNQSAAIAVDSETWQVVLKWVLFNSLFTISN